MHYSLRMKYFLLSLLTLSLVSCAGIKIEKNPPPQKQTKSGITLGGPIVGRPSVDTGFNCKVKHGLVKLDGIGMTEEEAYAAAFKRCERMFPGSKCERDSCEKNK